MLKRFIRHDFQVLGAATGHLFCFPFGTDNKH